jgi:quinol monooxygenase YgiN
MLICASATSTIPADRYGRPMLIIAGSITTEDEGARDAFFTAVKPMVAATHTEPGCREYVFSPDPDNSTRIILFEMWDDQADLDAHFATAHMAEFQGRMAGIAVVGMEVKKYTISDVGPVR